MSIENEIILDGSKFLVTETDEKGLITFANNDFCKVSGYRLDELVGHPHKIVRHPEMPNAIFTSLWITLKMGNIWSGCIKNRTKEGKFYWSYATIIPHYKDSTLQGYISCRRKATYIEINKNKKICNKYI